MNEGWIEFEGGFEGSLKGQTSLKTVLEERVRDARQWKQNCCKLLQVYVLFLYWLYPLKP